MEHSKAPFRISYCFLLHKFILTNFLTHSHNENLFSLLILCVQNFPNKSSFRRNLLLFDDLFISSGGTIINTFLQTSTANYLNITVQEIRHY